MHIYSDLSSDHIHRTCLFIQLQAEAFLQAIYLSEYKDATYYISKFSIAYVSYGAVLELIINQEGSQTSLCNVMDICGLNLL